MYLMPLNSGSVQLYCSIVVLMWLYCSFDHSIYRTNTAKYNVIGQCCMYLQCTVCIVPVLYQGIGMGVRARSEQTCMQSDQFVLGNSVYGNCISVYGNCISFNKFIHSI